MVFLQLRLFGHVSHHKRLADGLPAGDPKRAVPIRISPIGRVHEKLARNLLHGAQHRLIADPASPQGELKHHLFLRILSSGHVHLARRREPPIRGEFGYGTLARLGRTSGYFSMLPAKGDSPDFWHVPALEPGWIPRR